MKQDTQSKTTPTGKSSDDGAQIVLGIETSCDDTAAAIVKRTPDGKIDILSNVVWSQFDKHQPYGGVVPEIAARSHVERIDLVIGRAMTEAAIGYGQLSAIAATAGPGLVGGVMVGLTAGKALAISHDKPLILINHLEGHALSPKLADRLDFPYLLLLISGGHTQLIRVDGLGSYQRLGTTIDDAAGEAFDKTAKLLGLGQPGGPQIERAAAQGDRSKHTFPRPLAKRPGCDFSLSGLKTAVRLAAEALEAPSASDIADIAAAFQWTLADHLTHRTARAINACADMKGPDGAPPTLAVAGGVAANSAIKTMLEGLCAREGWRMLAPPAKYCTDNGAMIALAGAERLAADLVPAQQEALAAAPRARWPLAEAPEGAAQFGGGKKGPKA